MGTKTSHVKFERNGATSTQESGQLLEANPLGLEGLEWPHFWYGTLGYQYK